ncbi:unnamed protein product [Caenorhabditis auriculariae]|uniref:2-(3-amino-3-carboxypropyl)histidine synthase subunit 2 n=1 Tax=Caenorhabditis auriculariae TaxID=2777116 RepID=A0A8S1HQJ6_9PELO|nr:unnamed protein product [Caenorhabditis auriculariae]
MTEATNISSNQFSTNATPVDQAENTDASTSSSYLNRVAKSLSDEDVRKFFEIDSTVAWILKNNFQRVALQFPDPLLYSCVKITRLLEAEAKCKTFVLADTSYRSCCVDEVAAAHSSCDAIVHYGDACLSTPTNNVPVKYVLCHLPIDSAEFETKLEQNLGKTIDSDFILLLVDSIYSHATKELIRILSKLLPDKPIECAEVVDLDDFSATSQTKEDVYLGRRLPADFKTSSEVGVVFVGAIESPFLPLWLMSYPQCSSVVHFDPSTNEIRHEVAKSTRQLRKRLFLVEKLKDANTVGLIIGSMGVHGHREAVQRMRNLCKAAGKKIYVISVGKVNVAKLSNFASDIDVFVLISCPFGVILDSSEFYKPVLSFFEAEMALNPSKAWAAHGDWTADFGAFLADEIGATKIDDDDHGDVSLISGRVRTANPAKNVAEASSSDANGAVSLYTAGDYFAQRSWKGLDDTIRVGDDTTVRQGRSGIAQSYQGK